MKDQVTLAGFPRLVLTSGPLVCPKCRQKIADSDLACRKCWTAARKKGGMSQASLFDLPPAVPFVRGSVTSKAAAESIQPAVLNLREQVYECIARSIGFTCDQVEQLLGLSHQTVSARIRDLALAGRIVNSGRTRPTRSGRAASVWVVKG